ncbi:MAG: tetratricopeptide repeat protein, partial [Elusimicrobia bacterium]|nr:tetratricopeptide repeat protein [Elusimicrobiota bacterium]
PAASAPVRTAADRREANRSRFLAMLTKGRLDLRAGRTAKALTELDVATRLGPSSPEAFFLLGEAYFRKALAAGSVDKADPKAAAAAVRAYETSLGLDPSAKSLREPFILFDDLAQCREALGQYREAMLALKEAVKASPNDPMPHLYGARVRWRMRSQTMASSDLYWAARRALKLRMYPLIARLVRQDPSYRGLMMLPQNRVILDSIDAVQRGDITQKQADARIKAAVTGAADPGGDMRDSVRDVPGAAASRPASLDARPVDPRVQAYLDDGARAFAASQFTDASADYAAALSADSRRGTLDPIARSLALERLGSSYRQSGLVERADQALREAVRILPENSSAHYELALCLSTEGRPTPALKELESSFDATATLPQLRRTLLMAKTEPALGPVRDLQRFAQVVAAREKRLALR